MNQEAKVKKIEPRLHTDYKNRVKKKLLDHFRYPNVMMIPKLEKIVLSFTSKDVLKDKAVMTDALYVLTQISGQLAVKTKAKKSVANFKLRQGYDLGVKVTLRRSNMYHFFDRLITLALPLTPDFQGLKTKCNGGNYSFGLPMVDCFRELNFDTLKHVIGINIQFVTSAKTEEECRYLLGELGLPFKRLGV